MKEKPVALVSMPTLSAAVPSFQLALLKPTLERAGIETQTFSMFVYFGAHIGWELNEALSQVWPSLTGEWIWSRAAFEHTGFEPDDEGYFARFDKSLRAIAEEAGVKKKALRKVRDVSVPRFLDFCVDSVDWSRFGLIGFTVVFQQMLASIALARRLKRRYPHIPIIFGGATFEDDIAEEIVRNCPEVDYVHCGDGDETFPEMVARLRAGKEINGMRGIMRREGERVVYGGRAPNLAEMDKTPVPNFDEYFYATRESGYEAGKDVLLPIETARGCWWGMKNHCTFCGLNRAGMEFRAKSPESVLEMIKELSKKYGQRFYNAIDNILAPEYAEGLFARLAEARSDVRIHYEIRPNVGHALLKKMWLGGLYSVQPGVESFSTHVLTLMKKHTTGMRNVELLKWCTYYRINNLYNLLWGFAGETLEDYRLQEELIPRIHHLQSPHAIARARPDRGSPMFTDPGRLSIVKLTPAPCYEYLYPKDRFDLRRVSYYFEHEMKDILPLDQYDGMHRAVANWQSAWRSPERAKLVLRKSWDLVTIEDTRGRKKRSCTYEGRMAALLEACADARKTKDVVDELGGDAARVEEGLAELAKRDLVLSLDDRWLTLALPENPNH